MFLLLLVVVTASVVVGREGVAGGFIVFVVPAATAAIAVDGEIVSASFDAAVALCVIVASVAGLDVKIALCAVWWTIALHLC